MTNPAWNENPQTRRAEWVRRLRSGDYKQGRGQLRNKNDRYCCLGVLCEMAAEVGVVNARPLRYGWDYGGSVGTLPPAVREWSGVRGDTGFIKPKEGSADDLVMLNDDEGYTFKRIADVIESGALAVTE